MPLGISGTFNYMLVFQAEHNILMHPFLYARCCWGIRWISVQFELALLSEYGYKFGQEECDYNIVVAHGYFGRLYFSIYPFNNPLGSFAPSFGVLAIFRTWSSTMAFNLNGFNFNLPYDGSCAQHLGRRSEVLFGVKYARAQRFTRW